MEIIDHIPGVSIEASDAVLSVLRSERSISEVVLYGSRAKGGYKNGSDIDLTLKGHNLTTNRLMQLCVKLDDLCLPYQIDLSVFEHIENPDLVDHINRVGLTLVKND